MPIITTCSFCESKLKLPDRVAGKKVVCPKCSAAIEVPGEAEAALPEALPAEQGSLRPAEKSSSPRATRPDDFDTDFDAPPRRGAEDYEEAEHHPRRRGGRRRGRRDDYDDPRRPRGMSGTAIGLIIGGAVLAVGVVIALVIWVANQEDPAQPDPIARPGPPFPRRPRVNFPQAAPAPSSVEEALTALEDHDRERQRQGLQFLARAPVDENKRDRVLKGSNRFVENRGLGLYREGVEVLATWAGPESVPKLVSLLNPQGQGGVSHEQARVFEALGRLKDPRGAEAVAAYLGDWIHADKAEQALKRMDKVAEDALLKRMNVADARMSDRVRKILRDLGTGHAKLVKQSLEDLKAQDMQVRMRTAQWLAEAEAEPSLRDEVEAALLRSLDDSQVGPQAMLALEKKWGTDKSVPAVAKMVSAQDPNGFRNPKRDSGLRFLGGHPSEEGAQALVKLLHTRVGRIANQSLVAMGKEARPALLERYNDPDRNVRNQIRGLWKQIGLDETGLVEQSLADISSKHTEQRDAALGTLAMLKEVDPEQRSEVAEALMKRMDEKNPSEHLLSALVRWGTEEQVPPVARYLNGVNPRRLGTGAILNAIRFLGAHPTKEGVDALLRVVGGPFIGGHAKIALGRMGEESTPWLIERHNDPDPTVRQVVRERLKFLKPSEAALAEQSLKDLDSEVSARRQAALEHLGTVESLEKKQKEKLSKALAGMLESKDGSEVWAAIKASKKWVSEENLKSLTKVLEKGVPGDTFGKAQKDVLAVLSEHKVKEALPHMMPLLASVFVRGEAHAAIRRYGAEAEPALLEALKSPDLRIRGAVLELLGEVGTEKSISALTEAMKNRAFGLGPGAARAIERIRERAEKP